LIWFAAAFVLLYAAILTLSPAALLRSWDVSMRWEPWIGCAVWLGLFAPPIASIRFTPNVDPFLLPACLLISAWGTMTIWRLDGYFGMRQTIWSVAAVGLLILGLRLPGNLLFLRRYKYVWLTGGLLLTALTLVLGTNPTGFGPRMWLGCCGIYLQPSEPLKILLVIYLSSIRQG
jgi:cell division protein FtsW (lipid II flippase)